MTAGLPDFAQPTVNRRGAPRESVSTWSSAGTTLLSLTGPGTLISTWHHIVFDSAVSTQNWKLVWTIDGESFTLHLDTAVDALAQDSPRFPGTITMYDPVNLFLDWMLQDEINWRSSISVSASGPAMVDYNGTARWWYSVG